jgi:hypothetical protein
VVSNKTTDLFLVYALDASRHIQILSPAAIISATTLATIGM